MVKDVFISHSSKDRKTALKICGMLEQRGLDCWIAPRDVTPGKPFEEEIIDAIESTLATVLVLSEHANGSPHVRNEVSCAVGCGKTLIPVRICDVQPSKALKLNVTSPHWVEAWVPPIEQKMDQLASAIRALKGESLEPDSRGVTHSGVSWLHTRWLYVGLALLLVAAGVFFVSRLIYSQQRSDKAQTVVGTSSSDSKALKSPESPLTDGDISSINDQAGLYSSKIRDLPFGAAAYKDDLQALAERLQSDPRYSKQIPAAVATVYRLYSAALIMTPSAGNPLTPIRNGLPWLQRSTELYPDFKDKAALKTSQDFFIKLLEGTTPSVDASVFIGHQIRVAMIEATDDEVQRRAQEAIKTLTPMLKSNR
jgi:TIR domain